MESPVNSTVNSSSSSIDYFCLEHFVGPLLWSIFCVPCGLIGIPASVWLLCLLLQRQCSGFSNDIYVLNLTVMDLIFNMSTIPTMLNFFMWHDVYLLDLSVFLYSFNISGRPLFMICVGVDCYMAVVHPIMYMKVKTSRYRAFFCALAWIFTVLYGRAFMIISFSMVTISLMALAAVIYFCNLSILLALQKPDPSGRRDIHPQKHKATQAITNSLFVTTVSYLPPFVTTVFYNLAPQQVLCYGIFPSFGISALGHVIMPLLYLKKLGCLNSLRRFRCA